METLFQDIRFGVRTLGKNSGFTAIAVLTLALGIGANTAIFSVIDSVLLRPLPYQDAGELVIVWETNAQLGSFHNTVSPPNFLDWQRQSNVFSGMSAIVDERDNLTGNGEPEQVVGALVSPNFFTLLGVHAVLGTEFAAETWKPGQHALVLSYGLWKRRYGGDPGIIGKMIQINGHSYAVTGVAPQNFDFFIKEGSLTSAKPEMWSPWAFPPALQDRKDAGRFLTVVARLKPGVSAKQAQAEMNTIAARLAQQYPDFNAQWGVNVVPLRQELSGNLRTPLLILFGAVGFVLLIACANVSSLLLARATSRQREIAVRTLLGAGRGRIARQLLTESVLLALLGGGIGVTLAVMGTNVLLALSPKNLLDLRDISVNSRMLAFAAGATVLAGVLFGFLPSYFSAGAGISETLKEAGRTASAGKDTRATRSAFVVAQMCLALVLLAGSGLLIRSFIRLTGVDPGFNPSNLLTFRVALPESKYKTDPSCIGFFRELLVRLAQVPGVKAASASSTPPFSGLGSATAVHVLGQPSKPLDELPVTAVRIVGADYFRTLGIPLRAGRTFNTQETTEARHVVVVNQVFAERYLHGVNPIGQKANIFMKSLVESELTSSEIIGVVGDIKSTGLDIAAEPTVYWPHPVLVMSAMTVVVRTGKDPLALVPAVRSVVHQMDPDQPLAGITTMDELVADSVSRSRFTMFLLAVFAALALVLATVGVYGVIAYSVAQRTREIGIRMALGAQRRDVLQLVFRQGTLLTILGVGSGIAAASALTRLMAGLLYDIKPGDPLTFVGVVVLLAVTALAACYVPARRAMRVDPITALRYE